MWRNNTYGVIYVCLGKDAENRIICLRLLCCISGRDTGSENCGQLGHTEDTYPGNKRCVFSISQAYVWISLKTKHMCDVPTYGSCDGHSLRGCELVCAGQSKHSEIIKAQVGCCTLTAGSRGVQSNKYSLNAVEYTDIEPAGIPGNEGRVDRIFIAGGVSHYESTWSSEATCHHKHRFTGF